MFKTALLCLIIIIATGCSDKKILEELGMTNVAAFDSVGEPKGDPKHSQILVTIDIPVAGQSKNKEPQVLQAIADSPKHARSMLSRKTNLVLVSGQLRNLLFSEDLSKQGIWDFLDSYYRDYSVGERTRIVVVNGNASDLLKGDYPSAQTIGTYIDKLLLQEVKIHEVPNATLHSFARDYYDDGIDPVAPIVKADKDSIAFDGIALFNKDKYVTKISSKDAILFCLLHGSFRRGDIYVPIEGNSSPKSTSVMLSSIISRRNVDVMISPDAGILPRAVIRIKVSGIILEANGQMDFSSKEEKQNLVKKISRVLQERLEELVHQLQQNGAE